MHRMHKLLRLLPRWHVVFTAGIHWAVCGPQGLVSDHGDAAVAVIRGYIYMYMYLHIRQIVNDHDNRIY